MRSVYCPICRRAKPKKDVLMVEDGRDNTATLGPVVFYKCLICKSRLPIKSNRVKTLDGVGPGGTGGRTP